MSNRGKKIGYDLMNFAKLLRTYGLCRDPSELDTAGQLCLSRSTDSLWRYSLNKIVFDIDRAQGIIPDQADELSVTLTIPAIEGTFNDDDTLCNPLNILEFNFEIEGRCISESQDKILDLYSAWHLDKHIVDQNNEVATFSHPLYHLAYGGYRMEEKGHNEFGISLIMPAPRIFYPPMDAILGIDFILQNYKERSSLNYILQDSDYIRIVKNSQERLWKPFFSSMYSYWNPNSHSSKEDFGPFQLFPLYQDRSLDSE